MSNLWWFIILAILGLLLFLFTIYKTKEPRRKMLMIFLVVAGLSYLLEYVILALFHSYNYYPGVINDLWYDTLLGAIISQGITIPTVAMCIVAFHLNFYWIIGFSVMFMAIEEFFLYVGAYEQNWWQTPYTGILLIIGFLIGKWWSKQLDNPPKWLQWMNIYLTINIINHTIIYLVIVLNGSHQFTVNWFTDKIQSHVAFDALYWFISAIISTFIIGYFYRPLLIFVLYVVQWLSFFHLEQIGVLTLNNYWTPPIFALLPVLFLIISAELVKRLRPYSKILN
ncbi:hypothetical protein DS745_11195 [Anaerobacillus alkaliphilus]|uniref:Uncharacterized protein n=1 Tax=Anaerobacillus alkaliphilus TaxID=1548597 RepID=A0A4Q0VS53_9BACI|nr:hypothetical protein [Anaerobacillus alkaliphilus]RXJ00623.1 hypothetical protein DS745_11195 [Anaerobacillus alkaliphilus]